MKTTTAHPRTETTVRKASTKVVKEGTYYCADSHRTGFALGMVTMLFILSIINSFSPFITGIDGSASIIVAAVPWLLGAAFVAMCIGSYPYFMDGTDSDGVLYDDVSPKSVK